MRRRIMPALLPAGGGSTTRREQWPAFSIRGARQAQLRLALQNKPVPAAWQEQAQWQGRRRLTKLLFGQRAQRAARTLHVHGPHAVLDGVGGVRPVLHNSHAAARQRHAERPVGVPAASARRGWEVGGWVGGCCTSQCRQPQIAALQRRPHTAVRPDPALPKLHSAHSAQQAPTHP